MANGKDFNRIKELIAPTTWPQWWTGTVVLLTSTFQESQTQPEAIQLC
jgi:hypothetical protein